MKKVPQLPTNHPQAQPQNRPQEEPLDPGFIRIELECAVRGALGLSRLLEIAALNPPEGGSWSEDFQADIVELAAITNSRLREAAFEVDLLLSRNSDQEAKTSKAN